MNVATPIDTAKSSMYKPAAEVEKKRSAIKTPDFFRSSTVFFLLSIVLKVFEKVHFVPLLH
jgi:hypothetical protein